MFNFSVYRIHTLSYDLKSLTLIIKTFHKHMDMHLLKFATLKLKLALYIYFGLLIFQGEQGSVGEAGENGKTGAKVSNSLNDLPLVFFCSGRPKY